MINQSTLTIASPFELAQCIDHTLLKPTLLLAELQNLCDEARTYQFKTVCIPPTWVKTAVELLKNSSVGVATVVGFPLGYNATESKVLETMKAIDDGASEIDMVVNVSAVKNQKFEEVETEIKAIANTCSNYSSKKIILKVIIETAYLTTEEKIKTAKIAESAGALFVKTSTGFATPSTGTSAGATLTDVALLRKNLKTTTLIKASGGVRDLETALAMIKAGANRLGTSSGVAIIKGLK